MRHHQHRQPRPFPSGCRCSCTHVSCGRHGFTDVVRTGPRSMNFSILIWITTAEWPEDSNSILVRADFGRLLEKHGTGVYTLVLWVRIDGESVVVAEYSIFQESRRRIPTVVATIPSEGPMRTSWPTLRNGYWTKQVGIRKVVAWWSPTPSTTCRPCGGISKLIGTPSGDGSAN